MKAKRHRDKEKERALATDKHRFSQIGKQKSVSASIRVNLWLIFAFALSLCVSVAIILSSTHAQQTANTTPLEACLACHAQIEPMHKFGPSATLDRLDHGNDALGLTSTASHGGTPT